MLRNARRTTAVMTLSALVGLRLHDRIPSRDPGSRPPRIRKAIRVESSSSQFLASGVDGFGPLDLRLIYEAYELDEDRLPRTGPIDELEVLFALDAYDVAPEQRHRRTPPK